MLTTLGADVRSGARALMRTPGFTAVAVLMLALGIGVNTTIFSWLNAVLLAPLPGTSDTAELVELASLVDGQPDTVFSYPDYQVLRGLKNTSPLAAHSPRAVTLSFGGRPERAFAELVSDNFFTVLGTHAALGRTFLPEDVRGPGDAPVVVISDRLWHSRFGGDQNVVGRSLRLNDHQVTVVGVTAPEFQGAQPGLAMDVWLPITQHALVVPGAARLTQPGWSWMQLLGRLQPGVTVDAASAELDASLRRLQTARGNKDYERALTFRIRDGEVGSVGLLRPVLFVLGAVGIVVLLVTCANLGNLLLARGTARRRELAIRSSLGASKGDLVRQLLVESLLLSAAGTLVALAVAAGFRNLLMVFAPPTDLPVSLHATIDWHVVAFAASAAVLTTILFGAAPAFSAASVDLVSSLKEGMPSAAGGRARLRAGLVVLQVGLSMLLLVAAGLFVRSLSAARAFNPGFDTSGVLLASVDLYPHASTPERARALYRALLEKLTTAPGVTAATLADNVPLGFNNGAWTTIAIDGYPASPGERVGGGYNLVGPDYFRTLRTPVLQGRDFMSTDDDRNPRVVIVNQAMAAKYWPHGGALGGRIKFSDGEWMQVSGVVADSRQVKVTDAAEPFFWIPLLQFPSSQLTLHVRTAGDPAMLAGVVRDAVAAADPDIPLYNVRTFEAHTRASTFRQRMAGSLLTLFGALALVLSMIGLYAVLSYIVSQRTRELGVRRALGATTLDVTRLMTREALMLLIPGVVLGAVTAAWLGRFVQALLIGVGPSDPVTFAGVLAVIATSSAAAWAIPTRRALKVDPVEALRQS